jgi:hypothetical protein
MALVSIVLGLRRNVLDPSAVRLDAERKDRRQTNSGDAHTVYRSHVLSLQAAFAAHFDRLMPVVITRGGNASRKLEDR